VRAFILTIFVIYCISFVLEALLIALTEAKGGSTNPSAIVRMIVEVGFMIWAGILLWGIN
jgi:hypothetical protein